MKKPAAKKRRTPTRARTPVIAGRVPQALHEQIRQAAKQSGRSMSDELAFRAAMSFHWESAADEARKLLADAKRAIAANLRHAMRDAGLTPIHSSAGIYWMEQPGMPPLKTILDPELKTAIVDAVKQALAEAREG